MPYSLSLRAYMEAEECQYSVFGENRKLLTQVNSCFLETPEIENAKELEYSYTVGT